MKKTFLVLLCVVLLLMGTDSALAAATTEDTWSCEMCGTQELTSNFCPNCGVARPSKEFACLDYNGSTIEVELETVDTGHFVISVPSAWTHTIGDDGSDFYYTQKGESIDGRILSYNQGDDVPFTHSDLAGTFLYEWLESFIMDYMGYEYATTERIFVNGMQGVSIKFQADTRYGIIIIVLHEDYNLMAGYAEENDDPEEVWANAWKFLSTINLSDASTETPDV